MLVMKRNAALLFAVLLIAACSPRVEISASSVHQSNTANGLLEAKEPGWHAKSPPTYPEILTFKFPEVQRISQIGLLPQDGQFIRGPKKINVEISEAGAIWKEIYKIENACNGPTDIWRDHSLGQTVNTKYIRFTILSNCGNPDFLTLRGVRFK